MLKKSLSFAMILTLAVGLFAGCGQKAADNAGGDQAAADASKKVLVWNIGASPKTIDPGLNAAADGGHVINNMFEGLLREINGKYEPAMAESYTISDDLLTYTFKLRDAKWSDGKPVTAKDFEYAWKRVIDPATASEYAWIFEEANVGSFKAVDDKTFEVKLKSPTEYFLGLTAFYTFFPVREDAIAKGKDGAWAFDPTASIVNGPYKLESYTQGDKLIIVKNDQYWKADEVKIGKIEGLLIDDQATSLTAYESNKIDVIDGIPSSEVPRLMAEDPTFMVMPQDGAYYFALNLKVKPLDNLKVRKALALAIDRKAIVETVTKAGQVAAHSLIPGVHLDSEGNVFNVKSGNYGIAPDGSKVTEAKALLAEAGFPDGKGFPELEFLYNTSDSHKAIAEAVQEMWKQNLGINIKLANQEWAVFQDTRQQHNFQIARSGWIGDYSDPMTYLGMFLTGATMNYGEWANPKYDEAIKASRTLTGKDRFAKLYEADKILMEDMPVIPLYYYTHPLMVKEKVKGWELTTRSTWYFGRADIVE